MVQKQRNTCKICDKRCRGEYCFQHRPRKAPKQRGKHSFKWQDTRQEWIDNNPPNHQGLWPCELHISPQCLVMIDIDQLTIDHTIARSSDPKLRYVQSNLRPACIFCNNLKGSRHLV